MASDSSMCRGVDSASNNDYQVNPEGKGGRCVRLTTYHFHVPLSRNLGALISWNSVGLFRAVMGQLRIFIMFRKFHSLVSYSLDFVFFISNLFIRSFSIQFSDLLFNIAHSPS